MSFRKALNPCSNNTRPHDNIATKSSLLKTDEERLFDNKKSLCTLLTVGDVAKILNVSVKTIYAWVKLKRLRAVVLGRAVRFKSEDIAEYISMHRNL